ncbi:hypothetical protein RB195_020571 [Necator americanus]|uniref:C-type lectin domain-containing protein n=1 Tax=Necator americanus TaxID=51031 RepID=A0ABR1CJG8_NECAM
MTGKAVEDMIRFENDCHFSQVAGSKPCGDKDDRNPGDNDEATRNDQMRKYRWGIDRVCTIATNIHCDFRAWYHIATNFRYQKCPASSSETKNLENEKKRSITDYRALTGVDPSSNSRRNVQRKNKSDIIKRYIRQKEQYQSENATRNASTATTVDSIDRKRTFPVQNWKRPSVCKRKFWTEVIMEYLKKLCIDEQFRGREILSKCERKIPAKHRIDCCLDEDLCRDRPNTAKMGFVCSREVAKFSACPEFPAPDPEETGVIFRTVNRTHYYVVTSGPISMEDAKKRCEKIAYQLAIFKDNAQEKRAVDEYKHEQCGTCFRGYWVANRDEVGCYTMNSCAHSRIEDCGVLTQNEYRAPQHLNYDRKTFSRKSDWGIPSNECEALWFGREPGSTGRVKASCTGRMDHEARLFYKIEGYI